MRSHRWKPYAAFIALSEAVGAVSALFTREGTEVFQSSVAKSDLTPPPVVFPVVWPFLYALMGVSAARVWQAPPSAERRKGLRLFAVQLAVNFAWSFLFFNGQLYALSFLWLLLLWVLVLCMIRSFGRVDRLAARLQIPYLLWLSFAAYLNAVTWYLNR